MGKVDMPIDYAGYPSKYSLVQCKSCKSPMLGFAEMYQVSATEYEWEPLRREWPEPEIGVNHHIPEIARISLEEARVCFRAHAYSACAVMCGRALEGVCKHHNPEIDNLAPGLRKLKDQEIIDTRIFEWAEALREARNLGAHASTERVSREDATDLLDFCTAICDYVFVLKAKFDSYKQRSESA